MHTYACNDFRNGGKNANWILALVCLSVCVCVYYCTFAMLLHFLCCDILSTAFSGRKNAAQQAIWERFNGAHRNDSSEKNNKRQLNVMQLKFKCISFNRQLLHRYQRPQPHRPQALRFRFKTSLNHTNISPQCKYYLYFIEFAYCLLLLLLLLLLFYLINSSHTKNASKL